MQDFLTIPNNVFPSGVYVFLKRIFIFLLFFLGLCFGSLGRVFAFRLVRKHKEKVPKCPRKGPPEARICGSSGTPRKRKKTYIKPTLRSLSSLLGDFARNFAGAISGGVRTYFGRIWRSFWSCRRVIYNETTPKTTTNKTTKNHQEVLSTRYYTDY